MLPVLLFCGASVYIWTQRKVTQLALRMYIKLLSFKGEGNIVLKMKEVNAVIIIFSSNLLLIFPLLSLLNFYNNILGNEDVFPDEFSKWIASLLRWVH